MIRMPITPYQHQYPHFLDLIKINEVLKPFSWHARIEKDGEQEADVLCIRKVKSKDNDARAVIKLFAGTFLMIHPSWMYAWIRYKEGLLIRIYDLSSAESEPSCEEFIDIESRKAGVHEIQPKGIYDHFVTFIRKHNLHTPEDWHEKYVIVHLHGQRLEILPFTTFNETGGDPMYQWPALASLNTATGMLYGHGMRMGSFEVKIQ